MWAEGPKQEQIKLSDVVSDAKVDWTEIKNINEFLKNETNKKAFKEQLAQSDDVLKFWNSILNRFKNNTDIISIESETKKSFASILGFLIEPTNAFKLDVSTKQDLNFLRDCLNNPVFRAKSEISKNPDFLEKTLLPLLDNPDTDPIAVKAVERSLYKPIRHIREEKIINNIDNKQWYFQNIINALIEKQYPRELSDKNFIQTMKDSFVKWLEAADLQKMKEEIKNDLAYNETENFGKIKNIYNERFAAIPLSALKKIWNRIENLETEYKKWIIKEKMNGVVNTELERFLSDPEDIKSMQEDFIKYAQKKIDKYELSDVRYNYKNINDEKKFWYEFRKEIWEHLTEEIWDLNRDYIKEELKLHDGKEEFKKTFEDMLKKTSAKDINNLAYVLAKYPDKKSNIISDILAKIEKKGPQNCKIFSNVKFLNHTDIAKIDTFKSDLQKPERSYNYKTLLKEENSEAFDEASALSVLSEAVKNPSLSQIKISVPAWNDYIYSSLQNIINQISQGDESILAKFDIKEIQWLQNIKINTIENKEVFGSVNADLKYLSYNDTWSDEAIMKLFTSDEAVRQLINSPAYQITWWEITWFASRNKTNYKQKFFSDSDAREWFTINSEWIGKEAPNAPENTKNAGLAFDRAYTLLDYFLRKKEVGSLDKNWKTPEFKIKYGVDWPTRDLAIKELINIRWEISKEDLDAELNSVFEFYQNASIKIDFVQRWEISKDIDIDLDKKQLAQWLDLTISWDVPSSGGRKPERPRFKWPSWWGPRLNLNPGRFRVCSRF